MFERTWLVDGGGLLGRGERVMNLEDFFWLDWLYTWIDDSRLYSSIFVDTDKFAIKFFLRFLLRKVVSLEKEEELIDEGRMRDYNRNWVELFIN